ncbi:MAG: hypothetical protein JRH18_22565 [Deltaproteobacteria bacterium]|nr:hypothetical protein [Deltaproteobacteria bacterium]
MIRWRGRGLMIRAEAREDSPGTWETRTAPSGETGCMGDHRGEPETSRPALILPLRSGAGDTNKGEAGGTAKRRQRRAAGRHEGVLARA